MNRTRHILNANIMWHEVKNILASSSGGGQRQELSMFTDPITKAVRFEVEWDSKIIYHGTSLEHARHCYNNGEKANQPMGVNRLYFGVGDPKI